MVWLILAVYSALLLAVMVVGAPWWALRMATSGRYRAGWAGRLGVIPAGLRAAVAATGGRELVWVHAVSVGEVLAATALVRELRELGYAMAVSTTTQAGQELARTRFADAPVFYMPLDFAVLMRRYLGVLRPKLVVTMESELWPNLIHVCFRSGIPLAVVNARVSDRSFPRYMRLRRVWGPLLREVSLFLAQSEETAERLRAMGVAAERVVMAGNLKYDVRAADESRIARMVKEVAGGRPILVAGSTVDRSAGNELSEDEMVIQAWEGRLRREFCAMLVLAPRHTQRFEEVRAVASAFALLTATELGAGRRNEAPENVEILLLDTIGDLASVYGVADIAFVGGSLVKRGGHNPLEPAQFGVPVVMGESFENFREIVEAMQEAEAIRIARQGELGEVLAGLLLDREDARAMGARGRVVFEAQAGATARTVKALLALMGGRG